MSIWRWCYQLTSALVGAVLVFVVLVVGVFFYLCPVVLVVLSEVF